MTTAVKEAAATENTQNPKPTAAGLAKALEPLVVDGAIPLAVYYALHSGLGIGTVQSLIWSSVVPLVRSVASVIGKREFNALATLMLVVNIAGIVVSYLSGDARMMIAKDSVISSVIALGMLASVAYGKPLMSAALKPMMTKGDAAQGETWDRLTATSAEFRRHEKVFTAIWGACLLADCAARFVGAFTLPVSTMVWLGSVILAAAIILACVLGGAATGPMQKMLDAGAAQTDEV